MHDKDGDGFLTENDVDLTYVMYCGDDEEEESESHGSDQQED